MEINDYEISDYNVGHIKNYKVDKKKLNRRTNKRFESDTYIQAKLNDRKEEKRLDYYLIDSSGNSYYVFTKRFYNSCYELCKKPQAVTKLFTYKSDRIAVMKLVNCLKRVIPEFIKYEVA